MLVTTTLFRAAVTTIIVKFLLALLSVLDSTSLRMLIAHCWMIQLKNSNKWCERKTVSLHFAGTQSRDHQLANARSLSVLMSLNHFKLWCHFVRAGRMKGAQVQRNTSAKKRGQRHPLESHLRKCLACHNWINVNKRENSGQMQLCQTPPIFRPVGFLPVGVKTSCWTLSAFFESCESSRTRSGLAFCISTSFESDRLCRSL
jgi:hypothetical protein